MRTDATPPNTINSQPNLKFLNKERNVGAPDKQAVSGVNTRFLVFGTAYEKGEGLMSNRLRRKMRQGRLDASRSLGNPKEACVRCLPILLVGARIDEALRGQYGRSWITRYGTLASCPFCGCRLWLPIFPQWIEGNPNIRDLLRGYGSLVAEKQGIPANIYTFKADDFVIFADPPCACEGAQDGCLNHPRMTLVIEPTDLNNRERDAAVVARELAQILRESLVRHPLRAA